MGQEKQKRSKGKARNMLTPSKNRTPSQTIKKNLPDVAQYMHIVQGIIKERISAETGETFTLNNYTLTCTY